MRRPDVSLIRHHARMQHGDPWQHRIKGTRAGVATATQNRRPHYPTYQIAQPQLNMSQITNTSVEWLYTIRRIKNNCACEIVAREVMNLETLDWCGRQEAPENMIRRNIDVNLINLKSNDTETARVKCQEMGDLRKSGWVPDAVRMP